MSFADVAAMFDGGTYRPAPFDEQEYRALRQLDGHSLPHPEQPDWVRLNVQEWVMPHLQQAYGAAWGREVAALETPPPVDLRVNRIKATVAEAHRVPFFEAPPLARAIYFSTEIDEEIPQGLYVAVAQVLKEQMASLPK